jgi:hypothetical protein
MANTLAKYAKIPSAHSFTDDHQQGNCKHYNHPIIAASIQAFFYQKKKYHINNPEYFAKDVPVGVIALTAALVMILFVSIHRHALI